MPGIGLGLGVAASKAPGGFSDEYQTVYDSFTTPPAEAIASAQDTMARELISGGVWAKRDLIYLFAQEYDTGGEARTNWKDPTKFLCLNPGPATFTSLEGFHIISSGRHILTQWNPATDGVKYTLNDASFAAYQRTDCTTSAGMMTGVADGVPNRFQYLPFYTSTGNGSFAMNDSTAVAWSANSSNKGWLYGERSGAAAKAFYIDNVLKGSDTVASGAIPNEELTIFARNNNGVIGNYGQQAQLSYYAIGGRLSATEREAERAAVKAYMASNSKDTLPA